MNVQCPSSTATSHQSSWRKHFKKNLPLLYLTSSPLNIPFIDLFLSQLQKSKNPSSWAPRILFLIENWIYEWNQRWTVAEFLQQTFPRSQGISSSSRHIVYSILKVNLRDVVIFIWKNFIGYFPRPNNNQSRFVLEKNPSFFRNFQCSEIY